MRKNNNNHNLLNPSPDTLEPQSDARNTVSAGDGWSEGSSDWDAPTAQPSDPSSPIALDARNLCVNRGSAQTLCDVSFTLYRGDTLGLLGLNGAGKSTLLNVLSGSLAPIRGTVNIGEDELYENQVAARMNIGYAPDKPAVYPEFRVVEFLSYIARMRRIPRSQHKSAIDRIIEKCALGDVRKRIVGNLSSGYQQRVNLAQALIHEPHIVVLDEPANGLDPVQLVEMRELITNLTKEQATIFSSHLLPEVNAICNRVLLIHHGQKILDSPLEQLTHSDNNTFELTIDHDKNIQLSDLPGITDARQISPNDWIITGRSITESHIKAMMQSRGINSISLKPAQNYLECLFKRLNEQTNASGNPQ